MPDTALPPVLQAFHAAINAGDTDAFIALFPADGTVEDWGRRFSGHQAILNWSAKELIGAKGTLSYGEVIERAPNRISLNTHWASSFFTGDSVFTFVLGDDQIRELKISAG
ncbi:hypothetical protein N8A98_10490 [Devosia neptuniae]|jgi:hypothetical protein|uniref:SnoaL-like domain-containing protein n=1 Tax=Devosia neptuniae TaxID=191302 RepID=A0ABY6CIF5_9HYPH|nr:nuclear transport factor 2 family protein [Devosia neptuniae]UXN71573.1 hypothetical protein N8A98_10490 [Devosia neptuniae]